jgi:glucokinase
MQQNQVIGIDLGGTAIKFGCFTKDGECLQSISIPTPQPSTPENVVKAIANTIPILDPDKNCIAIGVGTPGPADAQGRIAKVAINLVGWNDVPLADLLETYTGLPTIIANDGNCAGLGEAWIGAGRHFRNVIMLTLGTGVGGAIVLDGKLFTGHLGTAGELGLVTLNPDGPPCNSGNQGSLEQYVSVRAIRRQTGKEPVELGELAKKGDSEALRFWQEYGKLLGAGLTSSIYVLAPEAAIIGGGISASAEFFLPYTEAEIKRRVLPTSRVNLKLLTASLGSFAGIAGAAKLAWTRIEEK